MTINKGSILHTGEAVLNKKMTTELCLEGTMILNIKGQSSIIVKLFRYVR